ncbi:hypothetical protein EB809_08415 [Marinobacter sp. R17]|nr:hypothetical protein EB809_08415 [Marinobacter sp. R17]
MYDKALKNVAPRLENGESVKAFAVVADKASNMRIVRIKQIEEMPPAMALEVMRRSLRVLVGKGDVGATCLVYIADNPNKDSNAKYVLVAEMEHIFGPTLAQITPYTDIDGNTKFGEPVVVESKPSIFRYKKEDGKAGNDAGQQKSSENY